MKLARAETAKTKILLESTEVQSQLMTQVNLKEVRM